MSKEIEELRENVRKATIQIQEAVAKLKELEKPKDGVYLARLIHDSQDSGLRVIRISRNRLSATYKLDGEIDAFGSGINEYVLMKRFDSNGELTSL